MSACNQIPNQVLCLPGGLVQSLPLFWMSLAAVQASPESQFWVSLLYAAHCVPLGEFVWLNM